MSSKRNGLLYASASLIFGTTVMGIILSNAELSLVKSSAPLISILLALCLATGALMFIWWFFRRVLPDILWLVINTPRAIKYLKYDIKLFFASKRQKMSGKSNKKYCNNSMLSNLATHSLTVKKH